VKEKREDWGMSQAAEGCSEWGVNERASIGYEYMIEVMGKKCGRV
jgi:hypothetical protein